MGARFKLGPRVLGQMIEYTIGTSWEALFIFTRGER